jgi:hypothetical protein
VTRLFAASTCAISFFMLLLASAMVLLASSYALSLMSIWLLTFLLPRVFGVQTCVVGEEFGLQDA